MPANLLNAAMASLAAGDAVEAEALARQALQAAPHAVEGWRALGLILQTSERPAEAFDAYEQALALNPEDAGVAAALSELASQVGMKDAALKLALHVAQARPGDIAAMVRVCDALLALDRSADAAAVISSALELSPGEPDLVHAAGRISRAQGRLGDAIVLFRAVLDDRPSDPRLLYDLAWTLADAGQNRDALIACDVALKSAPDRTTAASLEFLRATAWLSDGDLSRGWAAYAVRNDPALPSAPRFEMEVARWDGLTSLRGETLLVMAEQGLGDEIMFLGLVPDILNDLGPAGRLTLCVDDRLRPLVQRSWPDVTALAHRTTLQNGRRSRGLVGLDDGQDMPRHWAPLGDFLPRHRGNLERFQNPAGYLKPDPDQMAHWSQWLASLPGSRKVGLTWRSNRMLDQRSRYFAGQDDWRLVLETPDIAFISLQYGDTIEDLARFEAMSGHVVHQPPGLDLFNDLDGLAALCAALDLAIGFSNASANVAGAVGAPLWLITPPAPWTAIGSKNYPWYPQCRRFVAAGYEDWRPVMANVARALKP